MYLALGFGIAAPTFVLAGEGVRRAIARMLAGPNAAVTGERGGRQLART
jgi:hypothetical protein